MSDWETYALHMEEERDEAIRVRDAAIKVMSDRTVECGRLEGKLEAALRERDEARGLAIEAEELLRTTPVGSFTTNNTGLGDKQCMWLFRVRAQDWFKG
jgi:hypothetical protein